MPEHFSVYQFFCDGTYEQVRNHVPVAEAMKAAEHYSNSVGARVFGTTTRVIITDADDLTVFDWQHGKGIVWPEMNGRK